MRARWRLIVGGVTWLALIVGLGLLVQPALRETPGGSRAALLWEFWAGARRSVPLRFPEPVLLQIGDPVYVIEPPGLRQVGEVYTLHEAENRVLLDRQGWITSADVLLYPSAPVTSEPPRITYRTTPQTLAWAIERLVTPERQAQMRVEFEQALNEHRDEIAKVLLPAIERQVREVIQVIDREMPVVLERHRSELETLCDKYYRVVVRDRLVPLVKDEVFPTVRTHAEPELRTVGRELWQRVSLWRFGWRVLYDAAPLPDRNLTEQEWSRFVEQEARPVLERHTPLFVAAINGVLQDLSRNPQVQQALRQSLETMTADPELRHLAEIIFREAITDNPRVRETIEKQWRDPVLHEAVNQLADKFEPMVRRWGDMIFGTQEHGVTPEFAQILRLQILGKDKRFLLLETGAGETLPTSALPPAVRILAPSIPPASGASR